jgi:hypothetical protein
LDGERLITLDKIIVEEKRNAPKIEPIGINDVVSDLLFPAIIAVTISGAPFANAKSVTPANVSLNSK